MRIFTLPDLGEGLQEAEIREWHVAAGDQVAADQTMVSVETDKAIVEIPAPWSGTIAKLFGKPGEIVHVGAPLVGFAGESPDAGAVVGELVTGNAALIKATPAVRALARRLNVELAAVRPSGPDDSITSQDVERAAKRSSGALPTETLRGTRRTMAKNMALAHAEVASVTVMDDADVEAWPADTAITPRLLRAVVAGCRAAPCLNAWYDAKAAALRVFEEVHIGIAVDTAEGLLVPVLRDCHRLDPAQLGGALEAIVRDARERKLPPEALRGATITLSNYGSIAGRYASPIVLPPTVAILGAGRLAREVIAMEDGRIAVHRMLPLSLTFDHRAATGGEAGRFLNAVIADLSSLPDSE